MMFTADDLEIRGRVIYMDDGSKAIVGQIISPVPRSFDEMSVYKFKIYHSTKDLGYDFISGFFKDNQYYLNFDIKDERNVEDFARDVYDKMKMFDNGCCC